MELPPRPAHHVLLRPASRSRARARPGGEFTDQYFTLHPAVREGQRSITSQNYKETSGGRALLRVVDVTARVRGVNVPFKVHCHSPTLHRVIYHTLHPHPPWPARDTLVFRFTSPRLVSSRAERLSLPASRNGIIRSRELQFIPDRRIPISWNFGKPADDDDGGCTLRRYRNGLVNQTKKISGWSGILLVWTEFL